MSLTCSVRGKVHFLAGLVVLVAAACLLPATAGAQINVITKTVNCDTPGVADYDSIHQALNNTDWNGPLELVVTGTCHEGIAIGDGGFARNSVYIHPPDGQRATITKLGTANEGKGSVVQICDAHGIFLERLDISGGKNGILMCDASELDDYDVTIENNTSTGVLILGNSIAFFQASRIRNNGVAGVDMGGEGASNLQLLGGTPTEANVVEGNGQFGVNAGLTGVVNFQGPNIVRNNGATTASTTHGGIHASRTSAVQIQASVNGSTEIANNVGPGILAEVNSTLSLQGANIHDNSQQGVFVRTQSVVELVGQNTFTSNGIANISCDAWSLLSGDATGITSVTCRNIDSPPKPGK